MSDNIEIKDTVDTVETEKKDVDAKALVDSIFNNKPEPKKDEGKVKAPVNIFSKPIPVTQDDAAKKQRIKYVIIEALLFGAFLTAITAIFSFSGMEAKLDPENGVNTPSFWFFLIEFVFFTVAVGGGDYYITEKRVVNYNAKVAGVNVDIDSEIEQALREQEEAGITPEDAAAQNKANGEEAAFIDVKCVRGEDSLTDKAFEAYIKEEKLGELETVKSSIVDANGFENVVLKVSKLSVSEGDFKNGVAMELINSAKAAAHDASLCAVCVPASTYGTLELNAQDKEKYNINYQEGLKVIETYPGALMGVSGELK